MHLLTHSNPYSSLWATAVNLLSIEKKKREKKTDDDDHDGGMEAMTYDGGGVDILRCYFFGVYAFVCLIFWYTQAQHVYSTYWNDKAENPTERVAIHAIVYKNVQ